MIPLVVEAHLPWTVAAAALLLAHALVTHGPWFSVTWLGLTAALGAILFALDAALYCGVVVYLGGLLAKGFAERSRWKGAIPPFVLLHGLFAAWIALPWARAGRAHAAVMDFWWGRAAVELGLVAALFGLAYRLVSRSTEDDAKKCAVLAIGVGVVCVMKEL